jgi:predicted transcriptional regulator of viral defense system
MNNIWKQFGNTPMDYSMVASLFPNHKCKHNKVSALEKKGDIIRLKQGLYVSHPENSGQLLSMELMANHIYGPSYVSLHYALRYYGLIPERVYTVSSMTTKHSRVFYTPLARYEYVHVDEKVFPIGIKEETMENGESFMIATPEKALCDLISNIPYLNLRYKKEIMIWLEEDMRFDMDELFRFDTKILREYAEVGAKKNMINQLIKIIEQ